MLKKLAVPTALVCVFILAIAFLIRQDQSVTETGGTATTISSEDTSILESQVNDEPSSEATPLKTMVVTETCRRRSAPYINGNVIDMVEKGTEVTVVGDTINSYYPLSDGGYIHSDYLADIAVGTNTSSETESKSTSSAAVSSAADKEEKVMYTQQICRRRAEPSMNGEVLEMLAKGEKVTVVRLDDSGYYELKDGSYVHSDYLRTSPPEE